MTDFDSRSNRDGRALGLPVGGAVLAQDDSLRASLTLSRSNLPTYQSNASVDSTPHQYRPMIAEGSRASEKAMLAPMIVLGKTAGQHNICLHTGILASHASGGPLHVLRRSQIVCLRIAIPKSRKERRRIEQGVPRVCGLEYRPHPIPVFLLPRRRHHGNPPSRHARVPHNKCLFSVSLQITIGKHLKIVQAPSSVEDSLQVRCETTAKYPGYDNRERNPSLDVEAGGYQSGTTYRVKQDRKHRPPALGQTATWQQSSMFSGLDCEPHCRSIHQPDGKPRD